MFSEIDLKSAAATQWDVVIAGSSFASMFFLLGLPRDLRVLIVEKGGIVPWERQVLNAERPAEPIRVENSSDMPKSFVAHTLFGGNSNCWWGQTPRFLPNDFRLASLYGVGEDWPIGYDDLEPYYLEVERVMEIAGGGTDHLSPRSSPYPFPPHALSRTDEALVAHDPSIWVPVATARANGGSRAQCCANGICEICPIEAKFTVPNSIDRFMRAGVHVLTGVECRAIETEAGHARTMLVRSNRSEALLTGATFALATNAFSNATILLRSGLGGPATGSYLHEQASVTLAIDVDHPNWFGGSSITLHGYGAYDGDHRKDSAAVLVENFNAPSILRNERGRWTERLHMKLIAEDLPQAANRVRLDDNEEGFAEWIGHSNYARRGLDRAEAMLAQMIPFTIEAIPGRSHATSEAHIQGTHRMGTDRETSVIDEGMRLHEVSNLLVLGSGAFPSCSPANPTLTLSALSLRAGRSVS